MPENRDAHKLLHNYAALRDHDRAMLAKEVEEMTGGVAAIRMIGRDREAVEERRRVLAAEIGEDGMDDAPDIGRRGPEASHELRRQRRV